MLIGDIRPRTLGVGSEGRVTVRVRSPVDRLIVRVTVDFAEADGFPATGLFGTDLMAVNKFSFWPQVPGMYHAFVEAEDTEGCVTRANFQPPLLVRGLQP